MQKNRSKSTFLLPKIKQVSEVDSEQQIMTSKKLRVLKQIHRPYWGMIPKCLIKGHQGKQILYLCINSSCAQTTRLVCQQCFYTNHMKHNTQYLAIDQIKAANIDKLRFWPFGEEFRTMFQFVNRTQSYVNNMVQDVNSTFNEMALRIVNTIDKIRLNMLKKIDTFYIKQSNKKVFSQNLKTQLQDCFDLKRIQKTVSDLFNKKIKHSVFENRMNELLNDNQVKNKQVKLLDYFEKSDKGKDIQFDKQQFLKKQQLLLKNIELQQSSISQISVSIGQPKELPQIIPAALKYLQSSIVNFTDLSFQKRILQDKSQYMGFLNKSGKCIIGSRKYKNSSTYYGQWQNDNRNGWGILNNRQTGYKYQGYWKMDRKHGFGREESLNTVYQGNFLQDKKEGFGVLIKDGNRNQINWKNDLMHGQGKLIKPDGTQVSIYYVNGSQSVVKTSKLGGGMSLSELTKKYTKSTNTKSIISNAKSA